MRLWGDALVSYVPALGTQPAGPGPRALHRGDYGGAVRQGGADGGIRRVHGPVRRAIAGMGMGSVWLASQAVHGVGGRPRGVLSTGAAAPGGGRRAGRDGVVLRRLCAGTVGSPTVRRNEARTALRAGAPDRKSTRLNSSHQLISYAVFCLKKK